MNDMARRPAKRLMVTSKRCVHVLLQALQGDRELVEGVVQTLLKRCLKGASYGDRYEGTRQLYQRPDPRTTGNLSWAIPCRSEG